MSLFEIMTGIKEFFNTEEGPIILEEVKDVSYRICNVPFEFDKLKIYPCGSKVPKGKGVRCHKEECVYHDKYNTPEITFDAYQQWLRENDV